MSDATPEGAGTEAAGLTDVLDLADWRRRVAELYHDVRGAASPKDGWARWVEGRADLFLEHPQSPLPPSRRTEGELPRYFPYDPAARVLATVEPVHREAVMLPMSTGEIAPATRVGVVHVELYGRSCWLSVHWLDGYAGGIFVALRDGTSGRETYGSGRYLLDTVKGADLGIESGRLVLDFNFAYRPSCSYDPRWGCPLAPRDSWLDVDLRVGERGT